MIQLGAGVKMSLASQFPCLSLELPREAGLHDDNSATANWVSHAIAGSTFGLEAKLDIEALLSEYPYDLEAVGNAGFADTGLPEEQPQLHAMPGSPASTASSDSGSNKASNAVPRHKRASHKRAELKRRDKIKGRLDDLKAEIPSLADKGRMSETAVLSKAAEYAMHLKGDCERFKTEAANLRQEIKSLSSEIHAFQEHLPASGLTQDLVEDRSNFLAQSYKQHTAERIKENWKFYLFSFLANPMFDTYKTEVKTDNTDVFVNSVMKWTNEKMSLTTLRHQSLEVLRIMSRETSMLTSPENLPKEALASIGLQLQPSPILQTAQPATGSTRSAPPPDARHQPHLPDLRSLQSEPSLHKSVLADAVSSAGPAKINSVPQQPSTKKYPALSFFQKLSGEALLNAENQQERQKLKFQVPEMAPNTKIPVLSRKPMLASFIIQQGQLVPASQGQMLANGEQAAQKPVFNIMVSPMPSIVTAASGSHHHNASQSQQLRAGTSTFSISQLAANIQETTLRTQQLLDEAAKHASSTMMTVNVTGHEYDFDVTDVPFFPDVSDSNSNPYLPPSDLSHNASPLTCLTTTMQAFSTVSNTVIPHQAVPNLLHKDRPQQPTLTTSVCGAGYTFASSSAWSS